PRVPASRPRGGARVGASLRRGAPYAPRSDRPGRDSQDGVQRTPRGDPSRDLPVAATMSAESQAGRGARAASPPPTALDASSPEDRAVMDSLIDRFSIAIDAFLVRAGK